MSAVRLSDRTGAWVKSADGATGAGPEGLVKTQPTGLPPTATTAHQPPTTNHHWILHIPYLLPLIPPNHTNPSLYTLLSTPLHSRFNKMVKAVVCGAAGEPARASTTEHQRIVTQPASS